MSETVAIVLPLPVALALVVLLLVLLALSAVALSLRASRPASRPPLGSGPHSGADAPEGLEAAQPRLVQPQSGEAS